MRALPASRMIVLLLAAAISGSAADAKPNKSNKKDPNQSRAEYIQKIQQQTVENANPATIGSLWTPSAPFAYMAADYKARRLNDTVIITIVHQTTAQSTGDVTTERDFNTQSAITGLGGHVSTTGVNPILAAGSSTKLSGTGTADAGSKLNTTLAGQVIAVLPNGNLVVEAQRRVVLNNETETVLLRGVLRPGDIATDNSAPSTALMNLEVELKGKGVVSDANRPPNFLVRAILRVIGF